MIELASGNLLEAPVEALVNTVNTAGVMGRGIALQFKQAYPAMFRAYEAACKAGRVELGEMDVFDLGGLVGGPRWIINFPTKGHWRAASRIKDVEAGLHNLVATIRRLGIRSIAIPPLGCGNEQHLKREHLLRAWQRLNEHGWIPNAAEQPHPAGALNAS
jgi:O-acetyl-ADP-ribose deacetylase (regulator of RNase III)